MANYVRNYVYCCKELFDDFLYVDYDKKLFHNGMYGTQGYVLNDRQCLLTFETHGMKYCTDLIIPIIEKFNDTIWHCVEENEVEEGSFWYENDKVCSNVRELIGETKNCLIEISYSDKEWLTFRKLFINNQEAVIEDLACNKMTSYKLSQKASEEIVGFAEERRLSLLAKKTSYYAQFPLPGAWPVWHEIHIYDQEDYYNGSVEFENLADDYIKKYLKNADTRMGEIEANDLMSQLQIILDNNNIPVKIKFEKIIDMV